MSGAALWAVPLAAALLVLAAAAAAVLDAALDPAGPAGAGALARPVTETARLLRQRRRTTVAPDEMLWRVGTAGPLVIALLMAVVIPVGGHAVADLSVGVVWFNAMDVLVWPALWLAGWGPNGVFGLIGGYRFLAQALCYELPLMFALTAPAVAAHSLAVGDIVAAQRGLWYAVWMPVAFAVFLVSVAGFAVWGPLGYPAGRDAAGGVLTETSGPDRLLLLAGRYALLAAGAGMGTALFLGGGAGPLLPGWMWSGLKTLVLLAVLVALRRRLPVLRADRIATAAWLVVLPAVLVQLLIVSAVVASRS